MPRHFQRKWPRQKPSISDNASLSDRMASQIRHIEQRKHLWTSPVRKEKSPTVDVTVNNNAPCAPTIDEGSEINVLDLKFCLRWKIKFTPTLHGARAAGSTSMSVKGQTRDDIKLQVKDCESPIIWNLGKCIVVENLGVDLLIGEPGKLDNCIKTDPEKKSVETRDIYGRMVHVKYSSKLHNSPTLCRATKQETLLIGDCLAIDVPQDLRTESRLYIHPHKDNEWLQPAIIQPFSGRVCPQLHACAQLRSYPDCLE